jgi:multidrug efflux pump subunit AcrB
MVKAADELKVKLATYGGLYQIEDDYREGNREVQVDLKPEARGLGLTLDDLASQVYAGFYGSEAIRVQRGRDEVRVKVRYERDERDAMADLNQVRIRTPQGGEVPFFSVADVTFGRSIASISRVDGRRTIQVGAEVDQRVANAEEVLADLRENFMPGFENRYPYVDWSFEGAKQQSNDAFKAVLVGFPIAMLGIFVIIAATFRSYLQPFVVMTSVPFGMTGAIYGHYVMGLPLMMFSVFGMVALAGVVVNDSIVLIEAYNNRMGQGMKLYDALAEAGGRRFRAIILTTLTTVAGMGPLIFETNFAAIMLIPMALSVASGLIVSTVSTLVIVPCLIAALNDARCLTYRFLRGSWPTREQVEPGRERGVDRYEEDLKKAASPEPALVK